MLQTVDPRIIDVDFVEIPAPARIPGPVRSRRSSRAWAYAGALAGDLLASLFVVMPDTPYEVHGMIVPQVLGASFALLYATAFDKNASIIKFLNGLVFSFFCVTTAVLLRKVSLGLLHPPVDHAMIVFLAFVLLVISQPACWLGRTAIQPATRIGQRLLRRTQAEHPAACHFYTRLLVMGLGIAALSALVYAALGSGQASWFGRLILFSAVAGLGFAFKSWNELFSWRAGKRAQEETEAAAAGAALPGSRTAAGRYGVEAGTRSRYLADRLKDLAGIIVGVPLIMWGISCLLMPSDFWELPFYALAVFPLAAAYYVPALLFFGSYECALERARQEQEALS